MLGLLLWACTPDPAGLERASEIEPPGRIVLVVVDTLRADHLGLYGHGRPTSPVLDRWAGAGRVYTEARAPAPWTVPSLRGLFAAGPVDGFDPEHTIATRLHEAGWQTIGLAANPNAAMVGGLDRGWDVHQLHEDAAASEQVERALIALDQAPDERTFLFLHLMDPHLPYDEPEALRRRFAGEPPSERMGGVLTEPVLKASHAETPLTPEERAYLQARYDQNVLAVDQALARLFEVLTERDLVLFTSDHGEDFGERGVGHGHALTEGLVRVPLVVRGPGWGAGTRSEPVGLDDVGATILAEAGVQADVPGRSLRALAADAHPQPLGFTHYGPYRYGLIAGSERFEVTGQSVVRGSAGPVPFDDAQTKRWEAAGGRELVEVWEVSSGAQDDHTVASAPGGLTGLRIEGASEVGWPPRFLASEPRVERAGERIVLRPEGIQALPGVLWVQADGPIRVEVEEQGSWTALSQPPRRIWVPRYAPIHPAGPVTPGLKALGYVE